MSVTKAQLKKDLKANGIEIIGNYVRKRDIKTFMRKAELISQLQQMGITVTAGNYIRKCDVEKILRNNSIEVDAGFKEIMKKLGQMLLGIVVISQTAFGYQLQKVDKLNALMNKNVKSIAKEYGSDSKYEVKTKEAKQKNVQYVTFNFIKDGKTVATVEFAGTKSTSADDNYNVSTTLQQDDKIVEEVATALHDALQDPKGL